MMRRNGRHTAAISALVVLTAPLFALLCRGHVPSRFAASNLPFWQRALPHPAHLAVTLCRPPAAPGTVHYDALPLRNVNEDRLLSGLERPSSRAAKSGAAGEWLEMACALGRNDSHLRRRQDDVALRLMNAQDQDGYLAAGKGRLRWSPAQADAFGHNLRGLLAYYAVTRDPAVIYAAMQAGDLLTSEFAPGITGPKLPDGLLLPMTRLYLAIGQDAVSWHTESAPNTLGLPAFGRYAELFTHARQPRHQRARELKHHAPLHAPDAARHDSHRKTHGHIHSARAPKDIIHAPSVRPVRLRSGARHNTGYDAGCPRSQRPFLADKAGVERRGHGDTDLSDSAASDKTACPLMIDSSLMSLKKTEKSPRRDAGAAFSASRRP